jgi:pyrroloquinoline-quinone synthase
MTTQTLDALHAELDAMHLLNHDFYKAWNEGKLSIETLQTYAREYYHHVAAFPRYISAIHSRCDDIVSRQVLLGNLIEEEKGEENHPELWQRFTEGLGAARVALSERPEGDKTKQLVDGYYDLVEADYATGLGALYAYERQTPAVSKSKIDGLKCHYGISDERTLKFFDVHMTADEWHSDEVAQLIGKLDAEGQKRAAEGARKGAKLLWGFLDGMVETCGIEHAC